MSTSPRATRQSEAGIISAGDAQAELAKTEALHLAKHDGNIVSGRGR